MAGTWSSSRCWWAGTLLSLFLTCAGVAQDLRYLRRQTWSTGEGLPQDSVHQVLQTADGYLWVATEGGLARFDGVAFRVFNRGNEAAITSDDICCLAADREGSLWVGTADGLVRMRGESFQHFGKADGLSGAGVRAIAAGRDGLLTVLTENGLQVRQGDRFGPAAGAPADVQAMFPGRGCVWLISGGRAVRWPGSGAQAEPGGGAPVAGVAEGPDGQLWRYSNTSVTTGEGLTRREWRISKELPGTRVESLFVDRQGRGWVGTNAGAAVLDKTSGTSTEVAELRGNAILQTLEDREGNLWFGGETSGLHVLRRMKFRSEPGLSGFGVTAVAQGSDGAIWVGTRRDGLRRLGERGVEGPKMGALTSEVVLALAPGEGGSVWVGTPDGLNRVEPDGRVSQMTSADGLPDDYVQALAAGDDGTVWAGTRRGLVKVRGGRVEAPTLAEGLASESIGALVVTASGELWAGMAEGVVRVGRDGSISNYGPKQGLAAGLVTALAADGAGGVWVASGDVLSRFAGGRFESVRVAAGTGSSSGRIVGLAEDSAGALWLREERGIGRLEIKQVEHCLAAGFAVTAREFGSADGVSSLQTVAGGEPALWRMRNGEVWFATRRGVAITDAARLQANEVPPPVVIERMLLDDAPVGLDQGEPEIAYGRGRLTIEYAGLSFLAPGEVRYRFMLESFDKAWTDAGGRRSASYTNLPPGEYRFHVQAMNDDGVWNLAGAQVQFRIVPPYYRRAWFVVLMCVVTGLLAVLLYRRRLQRLEAGFERVLKERNRIAREIHDTLAQDFVGVSIQLDLIAQLLGMDRMEAAQEQIRQTRTLVMNGLEEARRSIWELRANASKDSLPARLRGLAERCSEQGLKVRLKVSGAYRELEPRVEDEVVRVAQESLTNVQRHAGVAEARMDLQYSGDMLVLIVEDQGRGFAMEEARTMSGHYGLRGLAERAAEVGGMIEIESKPGAGTTVQMRVPAAGVAEQ